MQSRVSASNLVSGTKIIGIQLLLYTSNIPVRAVKSVQETIECY